MNTDRLNQFLDGLSREEVLSVLNTARQEYNNVLSEIGYHVTAADPHEPEKEYSDYLDLLSKFWVSLIAVVEAKLGPPPVPDPIHWD